MEKQNYEKLKKEIQGLNKQSGETRVETLELLEGFILKKHGEEGLKKMKKTLTKLGIDYQSYREKRKTEWMPKHTAIAIWLTAIYLFNWSKKDIFEMGRTSISYSSTARIFLKYFLSIKRTIRHATTNWKKYYTQGDMEIKKLDPQKKTGKLVLKNFPSHPIECAFIKGLITRVLELGAYSNKVEVEEVKCPNRGDELHEFKINW